jgi:hypothetical protein
MDILDLSNIPKLDSKNNLILPIYSWGMQIVMCFLLVYSIVVPSSIDHYATHKSMLYISTECVML